MNKTVNRTLTILGCGTILAGGMVGSALVLQKFMIKVQQENTISVKGLAEKTVESDLGGMNCQVWVAAADLEEGYRKITAAYGKMRLRLTSAGFFDPEIEDGAIAYERVNKIVDGKETQEFSHYRFYRALRVVSKQVDLIERQSKELSTLLGEGIEVRVDQVEYFVSDLEKYKLELITAATRSAMKRAEATAAEFGGSVGRLITARNGVIQITRPASSDMSDYGSYDTSSRTKVIKVVISATFEAQ